MKQKWRNIFREIFASIPWGSSSACDNKKSNRRSLWIWRTKKVVFFEICTPIWTTPPQKIPQTNTRKKTHYSRFFRKCCGSVRVWSIPSNLWVLHQPSPSLLLKVFTPQTKLSPFHPLPRKLVSRHHLENVCDDTQVVTITGKGDNPNTYTQDLSGMLKITYIYTLLETNISHPKAVGEDEFPFLIGGIC